ncbi:hypothetical protein BDAP_001660 [Binucleata daphniae]
MALFLYLCSYITNIYTFQNHIDRNNERILPRLYIYSIAGDGFLEYGNGDNDEIVKLGTGYLKPLPFYYKETNIDSGLILSINKFDLDNKNEQVVLDLSKSNEKLITYKYHGYENQVFYFKAIDARTFKIHCDGSCVSYDDINRCFRREKCAFSKVSDNQLFEIYDDITLTLFKENIPELKKKIENLSQSNKMYNVPKNNDCVCPSNLILSKDKKSQINKPPKNCPTPYYNKNENYILWDEESDDKYNRFTNRSNLKNDAEKKDKTSTKNKELLNAKSFEHNEKLLNCENDVNGNILWTEKSKLQRLCQDQNTSIIADPLCNDKEIMSKLKQIADLETFAII